MNSQVVNVYIVASLCEDTFHELTETSWTKTNTYVPASLRFPEITSV